jgi:hypothetical protein
MFLVSPLSGSRGCAVQIDRTFDAASLAPSDNRQSSSAMRIERSYLLGTSESLAATFSSNVQMTMDPDHPRDTVLTDNLFNTDRLIVVS